jgi:hypothetical protein
MSTPRDGNRDVIVYLNHPDDPSQLFFSRLRQELESSKQGKAAAGQWIAMIKALTQKGVKQSEIDESGVLDQLGAGDAKRVVTREELLRLVRDAQCTIKQVTLAQPQYTSFRWPGGHYFETLFIANSQRANVSDRIEAIEFELEQINFDMDRLMDAIPLDDERMRLKSLVNEVPDFTQHHYSSVVNGKHGKNLIAHARYTIRNDLLFIEEIQSDWAQKWRRNEPARRYHELIATHRTHEEVVAELGMDAQTAEAARYRRPEQIPHGPFISNTELWTGLVLRRLMQLGAKMNSVKQIAWITGDMRNGGRAGGRDNLNDFYAKIVPKLCEKMIGKLGKVSPREVVLEGSPHTVLGIDITPELREKLVAQMPLYAHGAAQSLPAPESDTPHRRLILETKCATLRERFGRMIGSAGTLNLIHGLLDEALYGPTTPSGADQTDMPNMRVGRYMRGVVDVSLSAKNLEDVLDHEVFHVAYDRLLTVAERELITESFCPGSQLSIEVAQLARVHFGEVARDECLRSSEEAAAYAFSLWTHGRLSLGTTAMNDFSAGPVSLLVRVADAFRSLWSILRGERERGLDSPEKLFVSLQSGALAHYQRIRAQHPDLAEGEELDHELEPDAPLAELASPCP